jgi:flagellar biosynthesis protein FlhF
MNVKKFFGKNSREALAMVRRALGPDAVILANKAINGGNEILAVGNAEMESITADAMEKSIHSSTVTHDEVPDTDVATSMSWFAEQASVAQPVQPRAQEAETLTDFIQRNRRSPHNEALGLSRPERQQHRIEQNHIKSAPTSTSVADDLLLYSDFADLSPRAPAPQGMEEIMSEMREMRGAIESQLAELVWENMQRRDPTKSVVLRTLLAAGFGAGLARHLTEKMPQNQTPESGIRWVRAILETNLQTIADESEILDEGGVFALIGPTGVGKTTTIAKLAARYVMKHGTQKLALITTDAYRIGGHEQLRIYGKILGVMVHAVKDEADLRIALEELKGKHTILIDTVGVNQRDEMVVQQIAMLSAEGTNVKRLLCLSATNSGETLTDVVSAYKGKGLAGCILTKLDEAATIGSALDVIVREKLKLYYVANGQRVPEDLHVANRKVLIHHAFKQNKRAGSPFEFRDDELSLLMAHTAKVSNEQSLREMSLGY